jgi:coenzyme F420-0:L-glutamate ligase / coenzyme F420-1:gamma-L-glutamate ligase
LAEKMNKKASSYPQVTLIGVSGIPLIEKNDNLGRIICKCAQEQGTPIADGDIVVIEQKIVSKAENRVASLSKVKPSEFAIEAAKKADKEPEVVELVLREAKSIIRMRNGILVTRTHHGFICANSGIDKSNVAGEKNVTLLPIDPDASARRIRETIQQVTRKDVIVIVSDTFGRPFREGHTNVCIGVSGLRPILDLRGRQDLFGYHLKVKQIAIADELSSAAELLAGNASEAIPVVIVRGYSRYEASEEGKALELVRPEERDIFL